MSRTAVSAGPVVPTVCAAIAAVVAIAALGVLSLAVGSQYVPIDHVWQILRDHRGDPAEMTIVWDMRAVRTVVALIAGAALGIAGLLVQALTRNPIAEPGILGVNAGASATVAAAMVMLGALPSGMVLVVALVGALVSGLLVTSASGAWRGRHDPLRIVLVGAAWSAVVGSVTSFLLLNHPEVYADFRFWDAGGVVPRPWNLTIAVGIATVCAGVLGFALARSLDLLALGDDLGRALGASAGRVRLGAAAGALILCAAATALVGPISFLGLIAPYAARLVAGPRHRHLVVLSALFGAAVLLAADVLGRVVAPPLEVQAAIGCALFGAPLFIVLARRKSLVRL